MADRPLFLFATQVQQRHRQVHSNRSNAGDLRPPPEVQDLYPVRRVPVACQAIAALHLPKAATRVGHVRLQVLACHSRGCRCLRLVLHKADLCAATPTHIRVGSRRRRQVDRVDSWPRPLVLAACRRLGGDPWRRLLKCDDSKRARCCFSVCVGRSFSVHFGLCGDDSNNWSSFSFAELSSPMLFSFLFLDPGYLSFHRSGGWDRDLLCTTFPSRPDIQLVYQSVTTATSKLQL